MQIIKENELISCRGGGTRKMFLGADFGRPHFYT